MNRLPNPNIAFLHQKILEKESLNEIEIEQTMHSNIAWPKIRFERVQKKLLLFKNSHYFRDDDFIISNLKVE